MPEPSSRDADRASSREGLRIRAQRKPANLVTNHPTDATRRIRRFIEAWLSPGESHASEKATSLSADRAARYLKTLPYHREMVSGGIVLGLAVLSAVAVGVWLWRNARMYRAASPDQRRADDGGELGDDRSPAERGADIAATFAWRRR